jgi:hypothetical protein
LSCPLGFGYNAAMTDEERVRGELERVRDVLECITGLKSQWNGIVAIVSGEYYEVRKTFPCSIEINADFIQGDYRWIIYIHEMLHSFWVGNITDSSRMFAYENFKGYEEGVVEKLQRLVCKEVLTELRLPLTMAELGDGPNA